MLHRVLLCFITVHSGCCLGEAEEEFNPNRYTEDFDFVDDICLRFKSERETIDKEALLLIIREKQLIYGLSIRM